ncbi:MAG: hypothetical protein Q4P36_03085 [Bowdeniella nasicola]|nr:hypothetical protein [Bowdeniella nasicola]
MGGAPAPQWLTPAFVRSAKALGATADRDRIEAMAERLIERWQEADRHHHNIKHLIEVLQRVDSLAEETHEPEAVRLAAWYHGAVFDTSMLTHYRRAAGEDKDRSAALAAKELTEIGLPDRVVEHITEMIQRLKTHADACEDIDCQALADADLGSLACEPQKYRSYRENVRKEFAHVDVEDYLEARAEIITKLLNRPHLFTSPMAHSWEDAARENLRAELARVISELDKLKAARSCATDETAPRTGGHEECADASTPTTPDAEATPRMGGHGSAPTESTEPRGAVPSPASASDRTDAESHGLDQRAAGASSREHQGRATGARTRPSTLETGGEDLDGDAGGSSRLPRTFGSPASGAPDSPHSPEEPPARGGNAPDGDAATRAMRADQQEEPAAEVVGVPVTERPQPAAPPPTTWGIEREPSDLRSLPRRNAKTVRLDRRTELNLRKADEDEDATATPRRRSEREEPGGSLFRPMR